MTTPNPSPGTDSLPVPRALLLTTQIALFLNALLHGVASVGMGIGLGPHAAAEPHMGRRAAAAGLAGAFMLAFVARRLSRDHFLVLVALAFVLCNFADTVYEFLSSRDPSALAPAIPEATFLIVYVAFTVAILRRREAR